MSMRHGSGVRAHGLGLLFSDADERGRASTTTGTTLSSSRFELIYLSIDDWFWDSGMMVLLLVLEMGWGMMVVAESTLMVGWTTGK